jgi:hypothetical protein
MKTVYISNSGDDRNDGFSPHKPVHSSKRALKRQGGDNTIDIHVTGEAAKRITKEIVKRALAISRQSPVVIFAFTSLPLIQSTPLPL